MKHSNNYVKTAGIGRYSVAVLTHAFDVLEAITTFPGEPTLAEITRQTQIPKSKVFRLLCTLHGRGYVQRNPLTGRYWLGQKLSELGLQALTKIDLRGAAAPYLHHLAELTSETINLGVLEGTDVVYIEVVESRQRVRVTAPIGMREPAHSTSLGKAILAFLPRDEAKHRLSTLAWLPWTPRTITDLKTFMAELEVIRARGYATDIEETQQGACCVGASIFDREGFPMAAISVSGPTQRMNPERLAWIASRLMAATRACSAQLGNSGASQAPSPSQGDLPGALHSRGT